MRGGSRRRLLLPAPGFVELAVPAAEVAPEASGGPALPAWQIELELGGGVVLRIHRAVSC